MKRLAAPLLCILLVSSVQVFADPDAAQRVAGAKVASGPNAADALGRELLLQLGISVAESPAIRFGGRRSWGDRGKSWIYFRSANPTDTNEYSLTFRHRPTHRSGEFLELERWRGFPHYPADRVLLYVTNETTGRTLLTVREVDNRMVRTVEGPGTLEEEIAQGHIGSTSTMVIDATDLHAFLNVSSWTLQSCAVALEADGR